MSELSFAERRLIAALDRLDYVVERAALRMAEHVQPTAPSTAVDGADGAARAVPEMSAEIAALHDRQAATLEAMQTRLNEAHERLASTGDQAARLAAANDDLARANRALIHAAESADGWAAGGDTAALEAEIEALRAARAAEVEQMGEILDALDRMLGVTTTPRSHSTGGRAATGRNGGERAEKPAGIARDGADAGKAAEGNCPQGKAPDGKPRDAAPVPRELTVIRDEDPLPEDEPDEALADGDARDDQSDRSALFGGVYDDDPDSVTGTDEEERP